MPLQNTLKLWVAGSPTYRLQLIRTKSRHAVPNSFWPANPDVGIAQAACIIPKMEWRAYENDQWTIDMMVASFDIVLDLAAGLELKTAPLEALKELYVEASSMGYGNRSVTSVYEVLNPRRREETNC